MVFLLFASAFAGDNEKALSLQRMCTCAEGKGHEKSRGLIRVSASGYVMVLIEFSYRCVISTTADMTATTAPTAETML